MNPVWLVVVIFALAAATALGSPPARQTWNLVWSDEFEGTTLDTNKWGYGSKPWGTTDNPPCLITPEDTYLTNGTLVNRSRRGTFVGNDKTNDFSCGWAWSKTRLAYGYLEIRAQYPAGKGQWPAWWMLRKGWPPEIDIAEFRGATGTNFDYMTQAVYDESATWNSKTLAGDYTGWHVYGFEWGKGYLKWYIDGALTKTVTNRNIPTKPMYVILSAGLDTTADAATGFPNYFVVDYFRWYQVSPTNSSSAQTGTIALARNTPPGREAHDGNPILPGYYADPALLSFDGNYYLYATIDPWGGETLGCWESADFKNWTYRHLNWPTKTACTSLTSKSAMVWAPSVVRGRDGKFYMYVSVGNEVWAGVADRPLGPWKNLLGDKPLIPENYKPGYHMIDAEAFIDADGQAYLYWGSGWNWVNGKCWAVKLKPDMKTFDGEVQDVTPAHYFEAPFMFKHGGRYHLMYSSGKTPETTYQVHSAVGDSPFGPFTEEANSPVLVTDFTNNIISPGHHAVFVKDGQPYILYHRHSIPYNPNFIGRQVCVDRLDFAADGSIEKVKPTHTGPEFIQNRLGKRKPLAATATASSQASESTGPGCVLDDNYATRWTANTNAAESWIQLDFGGVKPFKSIELRPEYAWQPYRFKLERSDDGAHWSTLADYTTNPVQGSPIIIHKTAKARYLRLTFPMIEKGVSPSLFEWNVF